MIRRRITIHSISNRVVMVNRATREFDAWCKDCGKAVRMVAPEEAASIAQVSCRAIYRAIEAGEIHFLEVPALFVCRDSLLARFADSHDPAEGSKPTT